MNKERAKVISILERRREATADRAARSEHVEAAIEALVPGGGTVPEELETMTPAEIASIPTEDLEKADNALLLADLLRQRGASPEERAILAEFGHEYDAARNAAAICELLAKLGLTA